MSLSISNGWMVKAVCMFFLVLLSAGASAQLTQPEDYKPVGSAKLRVLWFDIYNAELSSPDGRFSQIAGPLFLKLTYLRNIKKQKLLDETANQLRAENPSVVRVWIQQLDGIWPEISAGDRLSFFLDDTGYGHFFFNERHVGSINDVGFGRAFISIWLGEDSDFPELARKLRGES